MGLLDGSGPALVSLEEVAAQVTLDLQAKLPADVGFAILLLQPHTGNATVVVREVTVEELTKALVQLRAGHERQVVAQVLDAVDLPKDGAEVPVTHQVGYRVVLLEKPADAVQATQPPFAVGLKVQRDGVIVSDEAVDPALARALAANLVRLADEAERLNAPVAGN